MGLGTKGVKAGIILLNHHSQQNTLGICAAHSHHIRFCGVRDSDARRGNTPPKNKINIPWDHKKAVPGHLSSLCWRNNKQKEESLSRQGYLTLIIKKRQGHYYTMGAWAWMNMLWNSGDLLRNLLLHSCQIVMEIDESSILSLRKAWRWGTHST